jgi:hypothetical protein
VDSVYVWAMASGAASSSAAVGSVRNMVFYVI